MPIVRAKFRNVTIGAASKPLTGWSWKNTSNLLHRDDVYSSFSPDTTPTVINGEGQTYGTYFITLSNLDFVFPNQLQSNYKLSLNWKYKLEGSGLQPKIKSAIMILPSGVTGKEKIIDPFNLTITNSGIDLELAEGFWTNTDQNQALLFSQLNNINFRIRVGIDFVVNNYNSSIDNFGIDYFYLVVSWNHRYGVTRSAFTSASVLTRTNVSTDNVSVPTILGSSSGWTWNNPSNALVDDNSHSFYSKPTVHNFGRTSTSSNYGQADWYVSDYLYLRNLQTKVSVSSEIVGMIVQFKKRASLQKFSNGYTEVVAIDDEVRLYNGSSIIGENKRGPRRAEARELVPWPKEENNSNISWFGWLPGGSGNNNSQYYGEQADNWGLTNITPTIVNDSNFGILISPRFSVHWWEKATWPIPWGVNFANIAIYFKLYNTEEFITPENLPSEENFESLPSLLSQSYIDVNSIISEESFGLQNISNIDIFPASIDSAQLFTPYLTDLISQSFIYPNFIESEESFSLNIDKFIEPNSINSDENFGFTSLIFPTLPATGNLLTSFLNFEVIDYDSSFGSTYFTWKNPNGAKSPNADYAYLDKDES